MDALTSYNDPLPENKSSASRSSLDNADANFKRPSKAELFANCPHTVEFFKTLLPEAIDFNEVCVVEDLQEQFSEIFGSRLSSVVRIRVGDNMLQSRMRSSPPGDDAINIVEARPGFEPGNDGFANRCLSQLGDRASI